MEDATSQNSKSPSKQMKFGTAKGSKEKYAKFDYKNVTYKDISDRDYDKICEEINKRIELNKSQD
jgi:hypothetical protein